MSHGKPKIESSSAQLFNDSPFLHFYIRVPILLFCPQPEMPLVGIVNKVSEDHIGLLVYGVFNASIPVDLISSGTFEWNGDAWQQGKKKRLLQPQTAVKFLIHK
jgi:DNA-directed RNA polymerase I subunit RPA43